MMVDKRDTLPKWVILDAQAINSTGRIVGYAYNASNPDEGQIAYLAEPRTCMDIDDDGYCAFADCDDSDPLVNCPDLDLDGYCACANNPAGVMIDCNDSKEAINPSATDVCYNHVDDNCNGAIDEGCPDNTIVVTSATWSKSKRIVDVQATSARGEAADLYCLFYSSKGVAYGGWMTWDAIALTYSISFSRINFLPAYVQVNDQGSAMVTAPVTQIP